MSKKDFNAPTIYEFKDKAFRIIEKDGEPWFVAKDVCDILGLGNVTEALRSLDDDEKFTLINPEGNPRAGVPIN